LPGSGGPGPNFPIHPRGYAVRIWPALRLVFLGFLLMPINNILLCLRRCGPFLGVSLAWCSSIRLPSWRLSAGRVWPGVGSLPHCGASYGLRRGPPFLVDLCAGGGLVSDGSPGVRRPGPPGLVPAALRLWLDISVSPVKEGPALGSPGVSASTFVNICQRLPPGKCCDNRQLSAAGFYCGLGSLRL